MSLSMTGYCMYGCERSMNPFRSTEIWMRDPVAVDPSGGSPAAPPGPRLVVSSV